MHLAVQQERDRPVVDQFDIHHGTKDARPNREPRLLHQLGKAEIEFFGNGWLRRRGKTWSPARATVSQQRELAHDQNLSPVRRARSGSSCRARPRIREDSILFLRAIAHLRGRLPAQPPATPASLARSGPRGAVNFD